jgi:hypothetical protein|tara:strand:- start:230 stop:388 length:159 start_codon:yes stop_codon:yes gene_type:complete
MFLVRNPDTNKPEIIVRFVNFETEQQAMEFVDNFKGLPEYSELEAEQKNTIH